MARTRRAKGEGSIIHVKPLVCKACPEYTGCTIKDDNEVHCSKRDRRERWLYQYWKVTPEGGKRRTSLCATSRKALLEKIEKLLSKADDGRYHDDVTLGKWIDIWEKKYLPHTVKPATMKYYSSMMKLIPETLKQKYLSELSVVELQDMITGLSDHGGVGGAGLSSKTVRGVRTTLISCLECAVDNFLITRNPCKKTRPPRKEQKTIVYLSPAQAAELQRVADSGEYYYDINTSWEHLETRYLVTGFGVLIRLAFATGMRPGELFGLRWKNVDLDLRVVRVRENLQGGVLSETKTKNSVRDISLDDP